MQYKLTTIISWFAFVYSFSCFCYCLPYRAFKFILSIIQENVYSIKGYNVTRRISFGYMRKCVSGIALHGNSTLKGRLDVCSLPFFQFILSLFMLHRKARFNRAYCSWKWTTNECQKWERCDANMWKLKFFEFP